ncbi:ubiquitin-specific protease [Thraustotheca clavata]|uniref:Ubiquitin-specific protease n=1 Tax=Thraustotheca clavata TaxID=74557 RepID=A0A1V9Z548_9STRA|nr:ubiquitin-specific protease [Thraustotheca clavata]
MKIHIDKMDEFDREHPLFDGKVQVLVQQADRDDKHAFLTIRLLSGQRTLNSNQKERVMRIEVTDDEELESFFLYVFSVSEGEFHDLKQQQRLLVDFPKFASNFMELLTCCLDNEKAKKATIDARPEGQTPLSYLAVLSTAGGGGKGVFSIVETNPFKHLTHLSLDFVPGDDAAIKLYLAARLRQTTNEKLALERELNDTSLQLQLTSASELELQKQVDRITQIHSEQVGLLKIKHAEEMTAQSEAAMKNLQETERSYSAKIEALQSSTKDQIEKFQTKIAEQEQTIQDLSKLKYQNELKVEQLQTQVAELEKLNKLSHTDVSGLQAQNKQLDQDVFKKDKLIAQYELQIAAFRQQLTDKEQVLSKTTDLLQAANTHKQEVEETLKMYKTNHATMQQKLELSISEINKGNQIIEQIQSENRAYRTKLRMKSKILKQQETIVEEKQLQRDEQQHQLKALQKDLQLKDEEFSLMQQKNNELARKLEESHQLLASNQQVITWLNKEINEAQVSQHKRTAYSSAYTFQPPSLPTKKPSEPLTESFLASFRMWITALDITYGQALGPPGFHRVTSPLGVAAEIAPQTYLWYKTYAVDGPSVSAIRQVQIAHQDAIVDGVFQRVPKALLRDDNVFLWYSTEELPVDAEEDVVYNEKTIEPLRPMMELKIVRALDDVPPSFESVQALECKELNILCFRRARVEEIESFEEEEREIRDLPANEALMRRNVLSVGVWVDVFDAIAGKWRLGQVRGNSSTMLPSSKSYPANSWLIHVPQYKLPFKEMIVPAAQIRSRTAPVGTHTDIYASPSYPLLKSHPRRQIYLSDIHTMRKSLDASFFDMQESYLAEELLPFLEAVLSAPCRDLDIANALQAFFQHTSKHWTAFVIGEAATKSFEPSSRLLSLFIAVAKLILNGFEGCNVYYLPDTHAFGWEKADGLEHVQYVDFAASGAYRNSPSRSMYFVENIEYFFQTGGYRAIIERIKDPSISWSELDIYLSFFQNAKPILAPSTSDTEELTTLLHGVFSRLAAIDMETLKDDNGILDALLEKLENIFGDGFLVSDQTLTFFEHWELSHLNLCKAYMCCPYLSQQLLGLNRLLEWMEKAQRFDAFLAQHAAKTANDNSLAAQAKKRIGSFSAMLRNSSSSITNLTPVVTQMPSPSVCSRWLRPEAFVDWIIKNQVLELVLGDSTALAAVGLRDAHIEVWKKTSPLLLLVAQYNLLQTSHLKLLWSQAIKPNQTVRRRTVYDMLLQLASSMAVPLVQAVANLLSEVSSCDSLTVYFITRITRLANGKAHQPQIAPGDMAILDDISKNGVDLLWKAMLDQPNEVLPALAQLIHDMDAIESSSRRRSTLDEYIQKSLTALRAHLHVPIMFEFLESIVRGAAPDESALKNITSAVTLSSHKNAMKIHPLDACLQRLNTSYGLIALSIELLPSHPKESLNFLIFSLTNSGMTLTLDQLNQVWANVEDKQVLFKWLLDVLPQCLDALTMKARSVLPTGFISNGAFTIDTLVHIFSSKLCTDFATVSVIEFQCFERLFRYLNYHEQRLLEAHSATGFSVDAPLDRLSGFSTLWALCINGTSAVHGLARDYIVYLLMHLSVKRLSRLDVWLFFVKHAMAYLDPSLNTLHETKMALDVLGTFLHHSRPLEVTSTKQNALEALVVYIKAQDGRALPPLYYNVPKTCLVGELRDRIAADAGHSAEAIRMLTDTKTKLTARGHNQMTLSGARIFNSMTQRSYIEVILLKKPEGDTIGHIKSNPLKWTTQDASSDWLAIKNYLGTNAKARLLKFLTHASLAEVTWRLIKLLPVEASIQEKIQRLEVDEWEEIISTQKSLPLLLYHLQQLQPYQNQLEWMVRFVNLRGAHYLRDIVISANTATVTGLDGQCWRTLIKWLAICLHEKLPWIDEAGDEELWSKVVVNIFEVIKNSFLISKPQVAEDENLLYKTPPLFDDEADMTERLVTNGLGLLQRITVKAPGIAHVVLESLNTNDVFLKALESPSISIRTEASKCLRGLCEFSPEILASLLNLLSSFGGPFSFPDILYLYGDTIQKATTTLPKEFNLLDAALSLCSRLKSITSESDSSNDQLIIEGLLHTLLCLLKPSKESQEALLSKVDLITELYENCLFPPFASASNIDNHGEVHAMQPKCKSNGARAIAFQLLEVLCDNNGPGLPVLLRLMLAQHTFDVAKSKLPKKSNKNKSTAIAPAKKPTIRSRFVGLKNLGCTCYLNSVVQACFFVDAFRHLIFTTPANGDENSLLFQLQSLFAHLVGSSRPYVNPYPLLQVLHTNEGAPINVMLQQDASEFLTSFLQQLEFEINGHTHAEHKLQKSLGGLFSNELVADGDRYSERCEPFYFISLQVRDRSNLNESLDTWVDGDMVSYTWDSPEGQSQTLETHKRISIHTLPNCLIFHLKRFEFDFETMQQIKIHDRFEFPMKLDMRRYTKEGQAHQRNDKDKITWRAPEYYEYELSGTIVHMGSAHSGHYYSYLESKGKWYEFNDTIVEPFDVNSLESECFGGSDNQEESSKKNLKNRSAFMLIYTRVQPQLATANSIAPVKSFATLGIISWFIARLQRRRRSKVIVPMALPESIWTSIEAENQAFWRKQYILDSTCSSFTHDVLSSCWDSEMKFIPTAVRFEALQFVTKFIFGTLWQCRDIDRIATWVPMLVALYEQEPEGCPWFTKVAIDHPLLLQDVFVVHKCEIVQDAFCKVAKLCVPTAGLTGSLAELFDHVKYLPDCFFQLLTAFITRDVAISQSLINEHNFINVLVEILIEDDGHLDKNGSVLELICTLLESAVSSKPELTELVYSKAFMQWLLKRRGGCMSFNSETLVWRRVIYQLCKNSATQTSQWIEAIMAAVQMEDHHDLKPYFRALCILLSIDDNLASERLVDGMTKLIAVLASQQKYFKATETSLDMLFRIAKRNTMVCTWLYENQRSWAWTEKWLLAHQGQQGWLQQGKTVLVKPNSTSSWRDVPLTHPALVKTVERSIVKLVPRVRTLLAGQAFGEDLYDSDEDPEALVGRRVKVKWAKEKWYCGRVERYNPEKQEHFVIYDDGDKKCYKMADKIFLRLD